MKTKILSIILMIAFVSCGQKSNFREFEDKTIFEGDTLNGKIKTIIENFYGKYSNGEDVIYTFDKYGLLVRQQSFVQDIFYYYKFNKIIKSSIRFADNGKEYTKNEYLYNKKFST